MGGFIVDNAHVFGPGGLADWFQIHVPEVGKRRSNPLIHVSRDFRGSLARSRAALPSWLRHAAVIGSTPENESILLDTTEVTDAERKECRVCWLDDHGEPQRAAPSFRRFIEDVCLAAFTIEGEAVRSFDPA